MNEECLLCAAPLAYLETDELMECAVCHKKESSKTWLFYAKQSVYWSALSVFEVVRLPSERDRALVTISCVLPPLSFFATTIRLSRP